MFRLQQNLEAEFDQDERKVIVRWTDNTDQEIGTYVERREGTTGNYVQIGNTVADQNVFMDSTFNTETTYYYRARHLTVEGFYTPYSNEDDAYVPALPPARPSSLQIYSVQGSATQFTLIWNDNSTDEEGFRIQRKTGVNGNYQFYNEVSPKAGTGIYATTVTIDDPNIEYFFRVSAYRGTLVSDFSNEVSSRGRTGTIELRIPTNSITPNSAVLLWEDIYDNEFVYLVERKRLSFPIDDDFIVVETLGGSVGTGATIQHNETGLSPNTQYVYRVRALLNTQEYSEYSNEVLITTPFN
ncbi:MAG: fibronectin type III domain-containing protein [Melioribacteraceae bacterium]|nr:fibronectin type III domain-containing protein [Melioribacteraceae bacterium]